MIETLTKSVMDVWDRLGWMFEEDTGDDPEILILGLTGEQMQACLLYLLREGRQMNPVFRLTNTGETVAFSALTPEALIAVLTEPPFEVAAMFTTALPSLPTMAYLVDESGCFTIGYAPGGEWNAMTLLALFDLLHR